MSRLDQKYKIDGIDGGLNIEPNYPHGYKHICEDGVIFIDRNGTYNDDQITLTISETKELIHVLQEIVDAVENEPVVGDIVTILDGELQGMTGKIFDIDTVARERELVVLIDKTENHDKFYAYVNKNNVE